MSDSSLPRSEHLIALLQRFRKNERPALVPATARTVTLQGLLERFPPLREEDRNAVKVSLLELAQYDASLTYALIRRTVIESRHYSKSVSRPISIRGYVKEWAQDRLLHLFVLARQERKGNDPVI